MSFARRGLFAEHVKDAVRFIEKTSGEAYNQLPRRTRMGKHLPKLEIKPYKDSSEKSIDNLVIDDYGIYLDGQEVRGLRSININMELNDLTIVEMDFAAEVEIDVEGLIELYAKTREVKDIDKEINQVSEDLEAEDLEAKRAGGQNIDYSDGRL